MKMTGSRANGEAGPHEPRLSNMLNDPVVRAVMRADGVDPDELARILHIPVHGRPLGHPIPIGAAPIVAAQPMSSTTEACPEVL